jgi:protocatechuate 3,4-dioxygenase beta subunit
MDQATEDRRAFVKRASMAAISFPFMMTCRAATSGHKTQDVLTLALIRKNAAPAGTEARGAIEAPDTVSWKTALPKKAATDEPLTISGTVFRPDGQTPAPNVLIYFYHTDGEGYYGRRGEVRDGHFRGWMLTDVNGRYEFTSIKPAPYPRRTDAAHIHMTLTGLSFKEDSINTILFEGDPLIKAHERTASGKWGELVPILKLETGADGVLRGLRNITLWEY